jgi:hypothetical protein
VLFFFLMQLFFPIKKITPTSFFQIIAISSFLLIFNVATMISDTLTTIRYSIVLYPMIALVSAWGAYNLLSAKKIAGLKYAPQYTTSLIFCLSLISLFLIKPFYFNYTSFFLPKDASITDSWGYGGYEASQYINQLPNVENLTVWSDYFGVCEFVKSKCITSYNFSNEQYKIDYFVLTGRGEKRYNPSSIRWTMEPQATVQAYPYYSKNNPQWELYIDDRKANFIKIFKAK